MKKFLLSSILLAVLVCISSIAFGQVPDSTMVPVPTGVGDVIGSPSEWFGSTAGIAGLSIFITVFIGKAWTSMTPLLKQLVALMVAMILVGIGNLLNFGFMAQFSLLQTLIYGLVSGLIANGMYDLKSIGYTVKK